MSFVVYTQIVCVYIYTLCIHVCTFYVIQVYIDFMIMKHNCNVIVPGNVEVLLEIRSPRFSKKVETS